MIAKAIFFIIPRAEDSALLPFLRHYISETAVLYWAAVFVLCQHQSHLFLLPWSLHLAAQKKQANQVRHSHEPVKNIR